MIGRNQNAWAECLTEKLENEGGYLARRLSGGGAVYHDLGNLNFTFLVNEENYNVDRQLEVIQKAVAKFGVCTEKSGRNDILINGRKFSGNAFYKEGSRCYHHGTIMLDVNLGEMSKYLTVSKEKLQSKGVNSVKARVTNLKEFAPELTVEHLKEKLLEAFEEEYNLKAEIIEVEDLNEDEIRKGKDKFSSWDWIFGRKIDFQYELSNRFSWGQLALQFQVKDGKIEDVIAFSDAMKPEPIRQLSGYLKGVRYRKESICAELALYWSEDKSEEAMVKDVDRMDSIF